MAEVLIVLLVLAFGGALAWALTQRQSRITAEAGRAQLEPQLSTANDKIAQLERDLQSARQTGDRHFVTLTEEQRKVREKDAAIVTARSEAEAKLALASLRLERAEALEESMVGQREAAEQLQEEAEAALRNASEREQAAAGVVEENERLTVRNQAIEAQLLEMEALRNENESLAERLRGSEEARGQLVLESGSMAKQLEFAKAAIPESLLLLFGDSPDERFLNDVRTAAVGYAKAKRTSEDAQADPDQEPARAGLVEVADKKRKAVRNLFLRVPAEATSRVPVAKAS